MMATCPGWCYFVEEVDDWFAELDEATANLVADAIDILQERGPLLGRPLADTIKGSKIHNMKELRPGSAGSSEVRILFCFDPDRQAILLVAGDKQRQWQDWYKLAIPLAEERYERWLEGDYAAERE